MDSPRPTNRFWKVSGTLALGVVAFYALAVVDFLSDPPLVPVEASFWGDPTTIPGLATLAMFSLPALGIGFLIWLIVFVARTFSRNR